MRLSEREVREFVRDIVSYINEEIKYHFETLSDLGFNNITRIDYSVYIEFSPDAPETPAWSELRSIGDKFTFEDSYIEADGTEIAVGYITAYNPNTTFPTALSDKEIEELLDWLAINGKIIADYRPIVLLILEPEIVEFRISDSYYMQKQVE